MTEQEAQKRTAESESRVAPTGRHPRPPSMILNFVLPVAAVLVLAFVVRACQSG